MLVIINCVISGITCLFVGITACIIWKYTKETQKLREISQRHFRLNTIENKMNIFTILLNAKTNGEGRLLRFGHIDRTDKKIKEMERDITDVVPAFSFYICITPLR